MQATKVLFTGLSFLLLHEAVLHMKKRNRYVKSSRAMPELPCVSVLLPLLPMPRSKTRDVMLATSKLRGVELSWNFVCPSVHPSIRRVESSRESPKPKLQAGVILQSSHSPFVVVKFLCRAEIAGRDDELNRC